MKRSDAIVASCKGKTRTNSLSRSYPIVSCACRTLIRLGVQTLRTSVSQQKPCRVSLLNYRKDGVPFWNVLHISPMLNRNGEVSSFVGIQVRDVFACCRPVSSSSLSLPVRRCAPVRRLT